VIYYNPALSLRLTALAAAGYVYLRFSQNRCLNAAYDEKQVGANERLDTDSAATDIGDIALPNAQKVR